MLIQSSLQNEKEKIPLKKLKKAKNKTFLIKKLLETIFFLFYIAYV